MYFQIVKTKDANEWHARLRSENERIVFWTQNYASEADARHACEVAQKEAAAALIREPVKEKRLGSPVPQPKKPKPTS